MVLMVLLLATPTRSASKKPTTPASFAARLKGYSQHAQSLPDAAATSSAGPARPLVQGLGMTVPLRFWGRLLDSYLIRPDILNTNGKLF
jgi:hypothetical protein